MRTNTFATFPLLLLLFSFSTTFAQGPILNGPDVNPQPGETYRYLIWDSAANDMYPIVSGAGNLTWDHSGATHNDTTDLESFPPANQQYASYFPSADVAIEISGITPIDFFEASASRWAWMGNTSSGGNVLVFDDAEDFLRFPISFGSSYIDPFTAAEINAQTGDTLNTRFGTMSADADAYGALILPYGTFSDVLRIQYNEDLTQVDSSGGVTTLNSEFYFYYAAGFHLPIMMRYKFNIFGSVFYFTRMLSAQTVAAHEPLLDQTSFFMYPNPARDQVHLRYVMENAGVVSLRVVDLQGKVVQAESLGKQAAGPHELGVDVNALPSGLYLLQLQAGEEQIVRKLQVR